MMLNPRIGQRVQLWYRERLRPIAPHHGKYAVVLAAGRVRPRNHLVLCDDGTRVIVPCGHLRKY